MSTPIGSSQWMYASGDSYSVGQSLRFNDNDSAYLNRTPSSAGNRKTFTFSAWIKVNPAATNYPPIFSADNTAPDFVIRLSNTGSLQVVVENGGGGNSLVLTNRLFRDPSSWYHLVVTIDTTNATANDRIKVYVNGVEETSFSSRTNPSLNFDTKVNSTVLHRLGLQRYGSYWDGYMAEVNFIDGTALDPTSFGEDNNGQWRPIEYSGSYGTNGFYLSSADSSAIGDDESGNTNDWTANNLAASDVVLDSPTNNFATLNPLAEDNKNVKSGAVLSEGNLVTAAAGFGSGTPWGGGQSTIAIPTDKKIYCEMLCSNATGSSWAGGVSIPELSANNTGVSNTGQINAYNRSAMINGVETDYGSSAGLGGLGVSKLAVDDILQIAVDGATGKVWFGRNGTYFKSPSTNNSGTTGDPAAGSNEIGTVTNTDGKPLFIVIMGNSATVHINFGADSSFAGRKTSGSAEAQDANGIGDFYYAPPTDYLSLCSSNMSDITIGPGQSSQADDYFNTVLWSGDGSSSNSITGVGFQPDWVWLKARNNGSQTHQLLDVVRGKIGGAASFARLRTDNTAAEATPGTDSGLLSLDSDGFTVGTDSAYNNSSYTYVGWNWKAGGSASSNSDGSNITSSVSANTAAGFSIVAYTGTGTGSHTAGHGLTQKPDLVIVKNRDADSSPNYWHVNHKDLAAADNNIFLNLTSAATDVNTNYAEGGIGLGDANVIDFVAGYSGANNVANCNKSGSDYIAYCFHSVEGYSKIGSYTGNGNADGTFVYTGFRPAWIMVKRSSAGGGWHIFDNKRPNAYNVINQRLEADNTDAENSTSGCEIDLVSNGFKFRGTFDNINGSGATHIYLAFAEAPFKFANAR